MVSTTRPPSRSRGLRPILFLGVTERTPVTGGERYDVEVATYLRRHTDVETVHARQLPPKARGNLRSNLWLIRRYYSALRRLAVIVDFYWSPRTFLFCWVAKLRGARQVCIVHHLSYSLATGRGRRARARLASIVCLAAMDRVVVASAHTAGEVRRLGVSPHRIRVISPGVNRIPAPATARRAADRPVRLLVVGNVERRKGIEHLLAALTAARFHFVVDIVGRTDRDPAYVAELMELVSANGLLDSVRFHGGVDEADLDRAYREADIFVAPSLLEGFGMAILDALLYGLPVIATLAGAIPELIEHDESGLLVPPADPSALEAALERLALAPQLRREMGERARRRGVQIAATWDDVGRRILDVVLETEDRKPSRR